MDILDGIDHTGLTGSGETSRLPQLHWEYYDMGMDCGLWLSIIKERD